MFPRLNDDPLKVPRAGEQLRDLLHPPCELRPRADGVALLRRERRLDALRDAEPQIGMRLEDRGCDLEHPPRVRHVDHQRHLVQGERRQAGPERGVADGRRQVAGMDAQPDRPRAHALHAGERGEELPQQELLPKGLLVELVRLEVEMQPRERHGGERADRRQERGPLLGKDPARVPEQQLDAHPLLPRGGEERRQAAPALGRLHPFDLPPVERQQEPADAVRCEAFHHRRRLAREQRLGVPDVDAHGRGRARCRAAVARRRRARHRLAAVGSEGQQVGVSLGEQDLGADHIHRAAIAVKDRLLLLLDHVARQVIAPQRGLAHRLLGAREPVDGEAHVLLPRPVRLDGLRRRRPELLLAQCELQARLPEHRRRPVAARSVRFQEVERDPDIHAQHGGAPRLVVDEGPALVLRQVHSRVDRPGRGELPCVALLADHGTQRGEVRVRGLDGRLDAARVEAGRRQHGRRGHELGHRTGDQPADRVEARVRRALRRCEPPARLREPGHELAPVGLQEKAGVAPLLEGRPDVVLDGEKTPSEVERLVASPVARVLPPQLEQRLALRGAHPRLAHHDLRFGVEDPEPLQRTGAEEGIPNPDVDACALEIPDVHAGIALARRDRRSAVELEAALGVALREQSLVDRDVSLGERDRGTTNHVRLQLRERLGARRRGKRRPEGQGEDERAHAQNFVRRSTHHGAMAESRCCLVMISLSVATPLQRRLAKARSGKSGRHHTRPRSWRRRSESRTR